MREKVEAFEMQCYRKVNFVIFGWEEDILNIACKLISTILCDWHCLVVCQRNSWANFILRQHRKRTILFPQGSVGTRNRCCGQYMHCFVGNLFRCKSAKNYKIRLRFHKTIIINLTSSMEMCRFLVATLYAILLTTFGDVWRQRNTSRNPVSMLHLQTSNRTYFSP